MSVSVAASLCGRVGEVVMIRQWLQVSADEKVEIFNQWLQASAVKKVVMIDQWRQASVVEEVEMVDQWRQASERRERRGERAVISGHATCPAEREWWSGG